MGCYVTRACDESWIHTDNSDQIMINMNMTEYSQHIQIKHEHFDNININCGHPEDKRYIKVVTDREMTDSELLDSARAEYDTKDLPCEDIYIDCTRNTDFPQECQYQYQMNENIYTHLNALWNSTENDLEECYWMEIDDLFEPNCIGTCGYIFDYYQYNIMFNMSLYINSSDDKQNATNSDSWTTSYRACKQHFGSVDMTVRSLQVINQKFNAILDGQTKSFQIKNITQSFDTKLQNGDLRVLCENVTINIINITSSVLFNSILINSSDIYEYFEPDQGFEDQARASLSNLFTDSSIPNTAVFISKQVGTGFIEQELGWIIAGCSLGFLGIIGIMWGIWKSRRDRKTIYIQRPMVISVAIGEYDKNPKDKEVIGILQDLHGIEKDIKITRDTFQHTLNYEFHPQYPDADDGHFKVRWTEKEIMDLLTQKASDLENNLANDEEPSYDGLIVSVSCHGAKDVIITSDCKWIEKTAIHRTFSSDQPNSRKIPRIFIFDCCAGNKEREGTKRNEDLNEDGNGSLEVGAGTNKGIDMDEDEKSQFNHNLDGKAVTTADVEKKTQVIWASDEDNPDHRLVVIHAANEGFQSKLSLTDGSFVIKGFCDGIINNPNQWLYKILNKIADDLHKKGTQLMVKTFSNNTEYIKFKPNEKKVNKTGVSLIEMNVIRDNIPKQADTEI